MRRPVSVYEDPHAWLRPYFAKLSQHPGFATFAPATRFGQLARAMAETWRKALLASGWTTSE